MPVHAIIPTAPGWLPAALAILAVVWAYAGFVALSLSQDRHHEAVFGEAIVPVQRARWLRGLGSVLLAASLGACLLVWGRSVGMAAWTGVLTIGAVAQALLLTWKPRWLQRTLHWAWKRPGN